VTGTSEAY
jgi:hypothetical protein